MKICYYSVQKLCIQPFRVCRGNKTKPFYHVTNIWKVLSFPARGPRKVWHLMSLRLPFTVVIASYATLWHFSVVVTASYAISWHWKGKLSLLPVVSTSLDKQLHYYCLCYVVFTWKFLLMVQVLDGRLHTKRVSWHASHLWRGTRQRPRSKAPVSSEEVAKSCNISKTWCPYFVKQQSLEQPNRMPVDLAVYEQFSLRTLCCSELRTSPAPAHDP